MYYDQIKQSKKLEQELSYFHRISKAHEDKSLQYLKQSLQNRIDLEKDDRNQKGMEAAMKTEAPAVVANESDERTLIDHIALVEQQKGKNTLTTDTNGENEHGEEAMIE